MVSTMAMASQVAELVRKYSSVQNAISKDDRLEIGSLCEVAKSFFQAKAKGFVLQAGGLPLLMSYSSDCTPLHTRQRYVAKAGPSRVVREGGKTYEFLVQQGFLRFFDASGAHHTATVLREPLPLSHGKGAWPVFSAGLAFLPSLRQMGHQGVAIQHYVFDRALHSALCRQFRQHHMALAGQTHEGSASTAPGQGLLSLLGWTVETGCCIHDIHNGLKWGLYAHTQDASLMKDMYIIIESLRNAYGLLHLHMGQWLLDKVKFVNEPVPREDLEALWTALGVDSDWVDTLACLGVIWRGGCLEVSAEHASDVDLFDTLSGALLRLWGFAAFSDSRWVTVGRSCRTLTMGLLSGVLDLAKTIMDDPTASQHHISGVTRLSWKAKKFAVMAAISAYPSDALLTDLLEDDRVVKRLWHLQQCLEDEMHWVANLPQPVWALLSGAVGDSSGGCPCSPRELRSSTIAAAHTSVAFVAVRVFNAAKQQPWSLAQGDIAKNLEELALSSHVPTEPTTQKIWRLLQAGFNRAQLIQGVELLREIGWSSASVEQQHGSASTVHRYRKTYGAETLAARSLIHCMRQFFTPSAEEKTIAELQKRLQLAEARRPVRFSARQLYFKQVSDTAVKAKLSGTAPAQIGGAPLQTIIMKKHAARFMALPEHVRAAFAHKALACREESARKAAEEVAYCRAQLQLHLQRTAAEGDKGAPAMVLSMCKFSPSDVQVLDSMWQGRERSAAKVAALRKASLEAPAPPDAAEKARLGACALCAQPDHAKPPWLAILCVHRDVFHDTALVISSEGRQQAFQFLYAKQAPYMAVFSPLSVREVPFRPQPVDGSSWAPLFSEHWDFNFATGYDTILEAHELGWSPDKPLHVIKGLVRLGGAAVGADGPLHSFEDFVKGLPAATRQRQAAGEVVSSRVAPASSSGVDPELLSQHPWLARHLNPSVGEAEAQASRGGSPSSDEAEAGADSPDAEVGEEQIEDLFGELYRKREEWFQTTKPKGNDFSCTILGGPWSFAQTGKATDSFIAKASTPGSKVWCTRYGMNQSARFSIALYGEKGAAVMAQAWADKLQHYYDIFLMSRDENLAYTSDHHQAWQEPEQLAQIVSNTDRVFARIEDLRSLRPREIPLPA
jgi:hypothetical protein